MSLLTEPLPDWVAQIKREARRKISSASFAAACRQGNTAVMLGLILGLWPFVDEFPKIIIRSSWRLLKTGLHRDRRLLNTLLHRGPKILSGIRKDEENHRKLWLETGRALGLTYPMDFDQPLLPQTKAWIRAVDTDSDPFTTFIRFAAIEIIAESISVDILASQIFTSVLGERGCQWFRVHAEHESGMTHEELEIRLAFAFAEGTPTKESVNGIIQHIVDLFVVAGEVCAGLGKRQPHRKLASLS